MYTAAYVRDFQYLCRFIFNMCHGIFENLGEILQFHHVGE